MLGRNGEKLSKQNGAQALDVSDPKRALCDAAGVLGLRIDMAATVPDVLASALASWRARWLA